MPDGSAGRVAPQPLTGLRVIGTTVTAYSLRAQSRPTVSTPVAWDEVRDALDADDPTRLEFEAGDVLERVDQLGDLYEPNLTLVQHLPDVGRR